MREHRKRGVSDISGLHAMRTLHSTGRRSIPRGYQSSAFIDLYMMTKEKERLEKETSVIGRRNRVIERRIGEIEKETQKLREMEAGKLAEGARAIRKSIPYLEGHAPREWKRMALRY